LLERFFQLDWFSNLISFELYRFSPSGASPDGELPGSSFPSEYIDAYKSLRIRFSAS